uniref:Terminal uridylyl transferase 7 n=1 Tax=Myripristis murdjan TaxID=586833 RepID=A0A667ZYM9_9TELE
QWWGSGRKLERASTAALEKEQPGRRSERGQGTGQEGVWGSRRNRDRRRALGEEDRGPVIDESTLSAKELLGLRQAEERLKRDDIFRLNKRSRSNPNACYSCCLCDVLLEHMKLQEQVMLTEILPPGPEQISAVSAALEAVVRERGMSDEDVETRQSIVSTMQDLLQSVLPEITLRLYGSSCTKFGFKDSDINIDIQYPSHMHQPDVLLLVQESLSVTLFVDLEADFHARVPVVICKDKKSGLICKVSAGNDNACHTTSYLAALASREPLLHQLVLCLRQWAWICQVDRAEEGGLPPYVFALMVIYFLQQRKQPLLPTYLNHETLWTPLGLLWVEMLRFYSLEFNMADNVISVRTSAVLSREIKDWPKKRIAVEDPFAVKRNVARTVNSQQMYEYILHCLKTTYKYFALPLNSPAANHKMETRQGPSQRADSKALSEEAIYLSGVSALSLQPQAADGPKTAEDGPQDSDCIIEEELEVEEQDNLDEEGEKEKVDLGKSSVSEDEEDELEENDDDHDEDVYNKCLMDSLTEEDEEIFPVDEISGEELLSDEEGPDLDTPGSMEEEEEVEESHMVVCSLCKRDGHLKKDCPEDFKKVKLDPLPPMTTKFVSILNQVCEQCYKDFAPDKLEVGVREHILQDLEDFVRRQFAGARLQLFGSSKNGFGFRQSDLDICMVLEGQDNADDLDCIGIIESLARLLKKHPGLRNILPITTAKVPIVKFYHIRTGLEGDISLYNTLALHNTNLLASYAAIDRRVKILCYVMKVFAKMCDIGDASRGSLSSYAYTLMVLFFLQQRNPPVIPVLQEIYDGEKKPQVLVDGWNVYFWDDLKTLPSRWPQYEKNTETVGELWLGLLRFYTEDFDFREHVVCIRQQARLTTFNKQWTSKYIVIEDPFDLNHNLGAGLSRRMTNFIMKAFINGRRVFGTPVKVFPPQYLKGTREAVPKREQWKKLSEKRCCFLCGSSAHIKRDCQQYRSPAGS